MAAEQDRRPAVYKAPTRAFAAAKVSAFAATAEPLAHRLLIHLGGSE